jgi:hypothetical protein
MEICNENNLHTSSVEHVGNYCVKQTLDHDHGLKNHVQSFDVLPKEAGSDVNCHRNTGSDLFDKVFLDSIS